MIEHEDGCSCVICEDAQQYKERIRDLEARNRELENTARLERSNAQRACKEWDAAKERCAELEADHERWHCSARKVNNKLIARAEAAEARVKVLEDVVLGFVEYFGAIERGEVGGSRPKIRTFEKVLLDGARQALAPSGSERGDGGEG